MSEKAKKINLLKPFDVSKISIEKDRYFHGAYIVDLPLETIPDHIWQDIFEREWKSSRHLWDRKLFIIGDKIRLITTEDDFKEKLDWIEHVINQTNKAIDEYNRSIEAAEELEIKKMAWEERAAIDRMREILIRRLSQI
ncbi:MAG: hypothetical protein QHH17_01000 [Candidatus Bathyarchaeota archaeon]|jgi:hypothetical protein|nr:hypothetical protein [Candidatus Bathyarchaeota archaeon]